MNASRMPNQTELGLLMTALLLLSLTCNAQQGQKENPECAPGEIARNGVCVAKLGNSDKEASAEEPATNPTHRHPGKNPIPICEVGQTLKDGKCVPKA